MEPDRHPADEPEIQRDRDAAPSGPSREDEPETISYAGVPQFRWLAPGIPVARPIASPLSIQEMQPSAGRPLSAFRAIIEIILVVPIALVGAVLGYTFAVILQPADERWLRIADSMGLGVGAALGCMFFVWLGRRKLRTIGLTTRNLGLDISLGIAGLIGTYMILACATFGILILHPELMNQQSAAQQAIEENFPRLSMGQIVTLCILVAFYEEIVFRGFLLTRLHAIVKRWWLAVPIGAAMFGSMHLYEGPLAAGVIGFLGLVLGVLFVWRKSLTTPITMHLLHNVLMFSLLKVVSQSWK